MYSTLNRVCKYLENQIKKGSIEIVIYCSLKLLFIVQLYLITLFRHGKEMWSNNMYTKLRTRCNLCVFLLVSCVCDTKGSSSFVLYKGISYISDIGMKKSGSSQLDLAWQLQYRAHNVEPALCVLGVNYVFEKDWSRGNVLALWVG